MNQKQLNMATNKTKIVGCPFGHCLIDRGKKLEFIAACRLMACAPDHKLVDKIPFLESTEKSLNLGVLLTTYSIPTIVKVEGEEYNLTNTVCSHGWQRGPTDFDVVYPINPRPCAAIRGSNGTVRRIGPLGGRSPGRSTRSQSICQLSVEILLFIRKN